MTKEVHGFENEYEPDVESTIQLFKEGYYRDTFAKAAYDAIEHEKPFDVELKIISGKGDERWIHATGEPDYQDGVCVRFYGISQNVTDRKKAEEDLQLNEQRFRALVQNGSDLIAILDEEMNYIYVSPTCEPILGYPEQFLIGKNAFDFVHDDDKERIQAQLATLSAKQRVEIDAFRFKHDSGEWRWLETTLTDLSEEPAVRGLVVNSRDITEKKMQQEKIAEALKTKETLLSEIHHRVKNNLSVVSGFIQMQAMNEQDPEVVERLKDSVARIQTMSTIHEQLYKSENFSKLNFSENIRLLVTGIHKSHQSYGAHIDIDFDCKPVNLNIDQAIPCSLIVNEVITNIFKHAFQGRQEGKIVVHISELNAIAHLKICDNGTGLPDDFKESKNSSLGLTLIRVLSEQLNGQYSYKSSSEGTSFSLQFEIADI